MDFNIKSRVEFKQKKRARMGIWDAMEMLNKLVDESDPDVRVTPFRVSSPLVEHSTDIAILQTSVSQIEHLLQTAEAMRRDNKPDWMQVTGLVHDLGKLLFMFGSEGQWDVVGVSRLFISHRCAWYSISISSIALWVVQDTFVVGCGFSEKIIYPETFKGNPDYNDPVFSSEYGIYQPHCGLDNVMLSWGHDEVSLTFI